MCAAPTGQFFTHFNLSLLEAPPPIPIATVTAVCSFNALLSSKTHLGVSERSDEGACGRQPDR